MAVEFSVVETSRFGGAPVELYLFVFGSGPEAHYAYTNAEQPILFDGITYRPVPIQREGISTNGTMDRSLLSIQMPKTLELPELFRVYPPSHVVNLFIRQGHWIGDGEETDFLVCWSGRVINVSREGNRAKVGCEPVQTSMRRSGLRQMYQYSCPHQLYGPRCRAFKRPFPAKVAQIDGTTVSLQAGWNTSGLSAYKFLGGMLEWDSTHNREPRTILRVLDTDVFLLTGFIRELGPGDDVDMVLGCAHDLRDCESVHDNVPNYGGDAWIPFQNPFGKNPF